MSERPELSPEYHGGQESEARKIHAQDYTRHTVAMKRRGFTGLKFDVDVPSEFSLDDYNRALTRKEIGLMAGVVGTLRKAISPEVDLAIDCHWNYGVNDAIKLARACEHLDLHWLEDPVPPENNDGMHRVTVFIIWTGSQLVDLPPHGFWLTCAMMGLDAGIYATPATQHESTAL